MLQLGSKCLWLGSSIVQLKTVRSQTNCLKALVHHRQGSLLFCDEEHSLALVHCVGQQIGNGLTLASTRGTLEDKRLPGQRSRNCSNLRSIGGLGSEQRRVVYGWQSFNGSWILEGQARRLNEVLHHWLLCELLPVVAHISPQPEFFEVEHCDGC